MASLNLSFFFFFFVSSILVAFANAESLRFAQNGQFKILQVADMHYGEGKTTPCEDVFPEQMPYCSDLNTTAFLERIIAAEKPDLIVFGGDNIYGWDTMNAAKSMDAAFAPAVASGIPWVAVLGNHDHEADLSRAQVMQHIVGMKGTLSKLNPETHLMDGFGNYNLKVSGSHGSLLQHKSVLNLYLLDSGDYSAYSYDISYYDWIKSTQQLWFNQTAIKLQKKYMSKPNAQKEPAPALVFFHIPIPEFGKLDKSKMTGVRQEGISSADLNSGFFSTMVQAVDVKAAFIGHDHLNEFCGNLTGIHLCYAGGFGYHAYGNAGWARRARVVLATLEKAEKSSGSGSGWGGVQSIRTWKRLDDLNLTTIDSQLLWSKDLTSG